MILHITYYTDTPILWKAPFFETRELRVKLHWRDRICTYLHKKVLCASTSLSQVWVLQSDLLWLHSTMYMSNEYVAFHKDFDQKKWENICTLTRFCWFFDGTKSLKCITLLSSKILIFSETSLRSKQWHWFKKSEKHKKQSSWA